MTLGKADSLDSINRTEAGGISSHKAYEKRNDEALSEVQKDNGRGKNKVRTQVADSMALLMRTQ